MVFAFVAGLAMKRIAQQPIFSPEVHSDRSVTFRLQAPNAQKVSLGLEGNDEVSMKMGADGTWTLTTQPLGPDIYGYSFNVDGQATFDPLNPEIKNNLLYVGNLVTVPGTPPEPWEVQDVPHGSLHHIFYKSKVAGDQRVPIFTHHPDTKGVKANCRSSISCMDTRIRPLGGQK